MLSKSHEIGHSERKENNKTSFASKWNLLVLESRLKIGYWANGRAPWLYGIKFSSAMRRVRLYTVTVPVCMRWMNCIGFEQNNVTWSSRLGLSGDWVIQWCISVSWSHTTTIILLSFLILCTSKTRPNYMESCLTWFWILDSIYAISCFPFYYSVFTWFHSCIFLLAMLSI